MPETTTTQLSESEVNAIERESDSASGKNVRALIRDWRALRAELVVAGEFKRLTDGLVSKYREENSDLRKSVEEWVTHYNEVEAWRAQLSAENVALREQLAQVSNERDVFKQQLRDLGYFAGSGTGYTGIPK